MNIINIEFTSGTKSKEKSVDNGTIFGVKYTSKDNSFTEEMAKRKVLSEYKDAVFIDSNIR